jgi:hypothetical protein
MARQGDRQVCGARGNADGLSVGVTKSARIMQILAVAANGRSEGGGQNLADPGVTGFRKRPGRGPGARAWAAASILTIRAPR